MSRPGPKKALIDADILCYRVGFATDDEPLNHALGTVKRAVANIVKGFAVEPEEVTLYITGKGNIRNDIATMREYKGSRKDAPRPRWYHEIREYMVAYHQTIVARGVEADDLLARRGRADPDGVVICSIDKDLLQVPCGHYNFVSQAKRVISPEEGRYLLNLQTITGDSTDDIPGAYGIGPKRARAMLDDIGGVHASPDDVKELCIQAYTSVFEDDKRREKMFRSPDTWYEDGVIRYRHWSTGDFLERSVYDVVQEVRKLVYIGYAQQEA